MNHGPGTSATAPRSSCDHFPTGEIPNPARSRAAAAEAAQPPPLDVASDVAPGTLVGWPWSISCWERIPR